MQEYDRRRRRAVRVVRSFVVEGEGLETESYDRPIGVRVQDLQNLSEGIEPPQGLDGVAHENIDFLVRGKCPDEEKMDGAGRDAMFFLVFL